MRVTSVVGAVATLACLAWALRPLDAAPAVVAVNLATGAGSVAEIGGPVVQAPLLATSLWNPPPAPAQEAKPSNEAPPAPPRYQLIGIIHEDGELKAALYDPGADRILIVRSGDNIEGQRVIAVNERSVEISDGTQSSTIILKEERS